MTIHAHREAQAQPDDGWAEIVEGLNPALPRRGAAASQGAQAGTDAAWATIAAELNATLPAGAAIPRPPAAHAAPGARPDPAPSLAASASYTAELDRLYEGLYYRGLAKGGRS